MGALQPWHIIIVVVAFLILFGSKKLPDAARGLGRSLRIFKSEIKEMQSDGREDSADTDTDTETQSSRRELPSAEAGHESASRSDDVKRSA